MEDWVDEQGYVGEVWRSVIDFDWYDVSDYGRIRSWSGRKTLGRIMVPRTDRYGYLRINLRQNGRTFTKSVHSIVAEAFLVRDEEGLQVNHIDGDKTNNSVENLEWMSPGENTRHAHANGLVNPFPLAALGLGRQRVRVRVVETGCVYESISDCALAIGGDPSTIAKCLKRNGVNFSHRGYHFETVGENQ